jgi:hypothetical protein
MKVSARSDDSHQHLTGLNVGRNVREQAQELLERPMVKELDLPRQSGGPARALMRKLGIEGS